MQKCYSTNPMMNDFLLFKVVFLLLLAPFSQSLHAEDFKIRIVRTSENSKSVTGELFVGDKFICHTLELPWKDNASYISSIPPGKYKAHLRYDKEDQWRIQLDDVPGRTGVQIHIGNYPSQIEGCVLVGESAFNAKNKVEGSDNAYRSLKKAFYGTTTPTATPNKEVSVEIRYNVSRTEFSNKHVVWIYDGMGRWLYGPERLLNNEYKRDMNYVYIKYRGPNFYYRFPIFGGLVQHSSSENGPWSEGEGEESNYIRKN